MSNRQTGITLYERYLSTAKQPTSHMNPPSPPYLRPSPPQLQLMAPRLMAQPGGKQGTSLVLDIHGPPLPESSIGFVSSLGVPKKSRGETGSFAGIYAPFMGKPQCFLWKMLRLLEGGAGCLLDMTHIGSPFLLLLLLIAY